MSFTGFSDRQGRFWLEAVDVGFELFRRAEQMAGINERGVNLPGPKAASLEKRWETGSRMLRICPEKLLG